MPHEPGCPPVPDEAGRTDAGIVFYAGNGDCVGFVGKGSGFEEEFGGPKTAVEGERVVVGLIFITV